MNVGTYAEQSDAKKGIKLPKFPDLKKIVLPWFFSDARHPYTSPTFPVFCVIFPDFSSLFKIPWLKNTFPFFQVFQSEWESCMGHTI